MTFLTGKGIIDDALSLIRNNSTPVRTKMALWLNVVAQEMAIIRPWKFLNNGSATVTPLENILVMPSDYGQLQSLSAASAFFFDRRHQLTPGEAFQIDRAGTTGFSTPRGFTESVVTNNVSVPSSTPYTLIVALMRDENGALVLDDNGKPIPQLVIQDNAVTDTNITGRRSIITLHGGVYTGDVQVNYTIEPQEIVDTTDATCWPAKFRPMFQRAILDFFYEYDMDERAATSYQLNAVEVSELKKWDNSLKPRTQRNQHGYRGSR